MDPLSIAASVAGLLSLCIQIGQTVSTLADALENVDTTISSFRGEISALSGVLQSISTAFSDPKRHRILEEASHGTGHAGQYWQGVVVSLDHCGETLRKMSRVLDGVQTSRRTRIFRSFGKHLKLTSEEGVLTLYRQEVQSHTANLQISLQMISVCLSLASDDMNADTSVRLDELSDDVRNIFRLLDRTRNDLPDAQVGDSVTLALVSSSRTVVDDLQQCLGAAELLISDASTLAEKASVRGSAVGVPNYFNDARRRRVQDWIDAPVISDTASNATNKTEGYEVKTTTGIPAILPVVDKFKPALSVHSEESSLHEEDAISESSDIDSGFKTNLYQAGLQYFEEGDYPRAERFFTKAVQASEEDRSKPADSDMLKIKFYLAQTLSKQKQWDNALALLVTLQAVKPTDASLTWMESSILHELALVYLGKGFADKARVYAKSATEKRKKLHGKKDPRFRASVGLLADICQSQGDPEAAEGYRRFIPEETWNLYTHIHKTIPEQNIDEKEVIAFRTTLVDNEIDDDEPVMNMSRSNSSTQPTDSNPVSRNTSLSRTASTPITQYSSTPAFTFPNTVLRSNTDSYVPPRNNTFELDSHDPLTKIPTDLRAYVDSQNPYLKEFLEIFRKVGQYQMLGWKEKAGKVAISYYKSFDSEKFKLVSRYIDDTAWRCLEKNILEGLSSLSSTGHGFSAIHFFSLLGIPSIVCLLLDRKADVSAKANSIFGYTQSTGERRRGKLSGLARSLSRSSINSMTDISTGDWTPLHFACAYSGDPETMQLLIDRGAELEQKAGKGYTPLLLASRKAALDMERFLDHSTDLKAIALLVGNGARVDAVDGDGLGIHAHAHCMKPGELTNYLFGLSVG